jgi:hyperosmotically inducible protein
MHPFKRFSALFSAVLLTAVVGCAPTPTREGTGEYVDDSVITTKVKTALLKSSGLNSNDISVETFKSVVQLSGFVNSQAQASQAVRAAEAVGGVKSVKNDMRVK